MGNLEIAALAMLFLAVLACAVLALRLFGPNPIRDRLNTQAATTVAIGGGGGGGDDNQWVVRVIDLSGPLAKLSLPDEDWENSQVRPRFMHAGLRQRWAPAIFFTAKTVLAIGLPLITFFALLMSGAKLDTNMRLLLLLISAGFGYYLPNVVLNNLIARRQRDIFENFPDALDLMTICVEAGLAIDMALARVAAEISLRSIVMGDELNLVTLEMGAGNTKEKALRNLALRTGVEDVEALVATLIQSERFGTSIAASLRVQSDMLRSKRRQQAEEQAAKIALKLLFPLIFFIFPSLLLVMMGPAVIQIYHALLPVMNAAN
jgi:tight adherence protein C